VKLCFPTAGLGHLKRRRPSAAPIAKSPDRQVEVVVDVKVGYPSADTHANLAKLPLTSVGRCACDPASLQFPSRFNQPRDYPPLVAATELPYAR
jgi:hypothetical protein